MFRIGHGYDVHQIIHDNKPLMLGGIEIPSELALKAHSDGDVILHALTDALLGAAALGDIGHHFPDTDPRYKNKASAFFIEQTCAALKARHFLIANVDITVVAQVPKLAPYIEKMRTVIKDLLELDKSAANVKATTTEKLGFVGRKEGIACHAVALIYTK